MYDYTVIINIGATVGKKSNFTSVQRAKQVASAQSSFRERMRDNGYKRLQEWIPEPTLVALKAICQRQGITQSEAITKMVASESKSRRKTEDL